jgi:hypothetical protein
MRKPMPQPKPSRVGSLILPLLAALLLWIPLAEPVSAEMEIVADTQNCLICHRYPAMGRFDESGEKHIYYVNGQMFANSVHGNLRCGECHTDIKKIPHGDVKKVDCTTRCHQKDPSTGKEFSHQQTAEKMKASVHGVDLPPPLAADLPTCKSCHGNRIVDKSSLWDIMKKAAEETEARCSGCHLKSPWVKAFFPHFTRRIRPVRSQAEIVSMCVDCHSDAQMMARHGIESTDTFKDTFHWTLVKFGVTDAPDCLSCHVATGVNTHSILERSNPDSSVNIMNRMNTCSNQNGVRSCHPAATPAFATGRVHAYGVKAALASGWGDFTGTLVSGKVPEKLAEEAAAEVSESESLKYIILEALRLFYKVFIGLVIGGMFYHQWMDYLSYRRERKKMKRKSKNGR